MICSNALSLYHASAYVDGFKFLLSNNSKIFCRILVDVTENMFRITTRLHDTKCQQFHWSLKHNSTYMHQKS